MDRFFSGMESLPFNDKAAEFYASNAAHLAATGKPIGTNDLMTAAIAQANDLSVVTRNESEFMRIPGLRVSIW